MTAVDPDAQTLTAVTADGRELRMGPEEIGADRLAHGFAITAHRSQGATVEVAHVLDDGGGREVAYVAMSRARHASHVYTVGGNVRDAAERLAWSWDQERRDRWVSDRQLAAERVEALRAERRQLIATVPPNVSAQLASLRQEQAALERDLADLRAAAGRWRNTSVGDAYFQLLRTQSAHREASCRAEAPRQGILGRRRARQDVEVALSAVEEAEGALRRESEPLARRLCERQAALADEARRVGARQQVRTAFIEANPEVINRIVELGRALEIERLPDQRSRAAAGGQRRTLRRTAAVAHEPSAAPAIAHPSGPDL